MRMYATIYVHRFICMPGAQTRVTRRRRWQRRRQKRVCAVAYDLIFIHDTYIFLFHRARARVALAERMDACKCVRAYGFGCAGGDCAKRSGAYRRALAHGYTTKRTLRSIFTKIPRTRWRWRARSRNAHIWCDDDHMRWNGGTEKTKNGRRRRRRRTGAVRLLFLGSPNLLVISQMWRSNSIRQSHSATESVARFHARSCSCCGANVENGYKWGARRSSSFRYARRVVFFGVRQKNARQWRRGALSSLASSPSLPPWTKNKCL